MAVVATVQTGGAPRWPSGRAACRRMRPGDGPFSWLVCISLGLCPDWAEWDPNQPVENAREAMQQADDWLGVPQVRPTDFH